VKLSRLLLPATLCLFALPSEAGLYSDTLARCIVDSTTRDDRMNLVVWMFTAASLHPAVEPISSVTEADIEASNTTIARMMERLLTETCRAETLDAVNNDGPNSIAAAFQVLGQVAGEELFASREVASALAGLETAFDSDKLQSLFDEAD